MMTRPLLAQRGFTLMEIMVAVSIFALIAAMTMTNLIQVGRTGEKVSAAQARLSEVQFALAYLSRDVAQLTARAVRDQYGDKQSALKLTENRLAFTRGGWRNLLAQPRSDLQRVEYLLDDEKLVRRFWPQLDQSYEDVHVDQPLLEGVEELTIELLTAGKPRYSAWPPEFETEERPQPPVALELVLSVKDFGRIERVFELVDVAG
jgi:general secretion pathway protein J